MKTNFTLKQKNCGLEKPESIELFSIRDTLNRTFGLIGLIMLTTIMSNPVFAQTKNVTESKSATQKIVVKGVVSDETEPLYLVNVVLEGTKTGTSTNEKGEFTFPKSLKYGDVLIFSYLGYDTAKIRINETSTFIKLLLTSGTIEVIGDLNVEKPYKSKRSN